MAQILQLDEKRKSIIDMLESKGEGEITIGQMPFRIPAGKSKVWKRN
ncbi:hypothetical protein SB775_02080 [Peribacillus sp. SIMBA_075]